MLKKLTLIGFVVMVLVQLFVPLQMIFDSNEVIEEGKAFKFKTRPADPIDPFRGNYMRLGFKSSSYHSVDSLPFARGQKIYALIRENKEGYAEIYSLQETQPTHTEDYIEVKMKYCYKRDSHYTTTLDFPFDKFYMQEEKAPIAERIYREASRDSAKITYSLVSVKNGTGILQGVYVDGVSLVELAGDSLDVK